MLIDVLNKKMWAKKTMSHLPNVKWFRQREREKNMRGKKKVFFLLSLLTSTVVMIIVRRITTWRRKNECQCRFVIS